VTPPVCPERIQRQWDACNLKGWDGARGEDSRRSGIIDRLEGGVP